MSISEKLATIAENEQKVYAAGQKSEYDKFWDAYQHVLDGNSQVYSAQYMFASSSWNDKTFKPKYSMTYINSANHMFNSTSITDLASILEERGLVFDYKNVKNTFAYTYSYSKLTRVPELNSINGTGFASTFYGSKQLHTIDKIILKVDGSQTFSNTFYDCEALENLTFAGANETEETGPTGFIGQNGLNLQYSTKLSKASIKNVVNHLLPTASGKTITISLTAVNNAFETATGAADGSTSTEWEVLKATKSNWTISLI